SQVFNSPANRVRFLRESALWALPQLSLATVTFLAGTLGLALLPLSVGCFSSRRWKVAITTLVLLGAVVTAELATGHDYSPPLAWGQTWSLGELGYTEPLLSDYVEPTTGRGWTWMVALVALGSASVLVARSAEPLDTAGIYLVLQMIGHFALIAILWLQWDR